MAKMKLKKDTAEARAQAYEFYKGALDPLDPTYEQRCSEACFRLAYAGCAFSTMGEYAEWFHRDQLAWDRGHGPDAMWAFKRPLREFIDWEKAGALMLQGKSDYPGRQWWTTPHPADASKLAVFTELPDDELMDAIGPVSRKLSA